MKVRIQLDFAYCQPLQEFLTNLDTYHARMVDWVTNGPAGGNPCITLEFETREWCEKYLDAHDAEPEYMKKFIQPC